MLDTQTDTREVTGGIDTHAKKKTANKLVTLIRSYGTEEANYLTKLGHTTTAKGLTYGINELANYVGGW